VDLANYAVNAVLVEGRSVRAVAVATGTSKSWVHRHVQLYRAGGQEALEPQRRGPRRPPALTAPGVEDEIVWWRKHLDEAGFDAGARTIHYHLSQAHSSVPSLSTIHRVLRRRGLVVDQPQKRPRSSWIRFEAALPNECWQSDMTHWHVGEDKVEILHFIDDCSRAVLSSKVLPSATAPDTIELPPGVCPSRCSLTTARSIAPPTAGRRRASRSISLRWASTLSTASPTIPRPRARSSATTRRSRSG
jgi:transposase